jgi:pyridinium-3,5-biscarboxylic acid mononucleotide sulfurtransferase
MMEETARKLESLASVLAGMERIAVAVSGGIDSLTLATVAHRDCGARVEMFHAVSPAVPREATQRVETLAAEQGWRLQVFDAGEFDDGSYRANPVNRCFYCKTSLYGAIAPRTGAQIVSGTNLDDLGEYRPGLEAARHHSVRHPFVEARIDKAAVRAIARAVGLGNLAELPSAPCLSSRIETGIAIDPGMLALVHETEKLVGEVLQPRTVRCRVRAEGVVIELDETRLAALDPSQRTALGARVGALFRDGGFDYPVSFASYRVGSAFLHRIAAPATRSRQSDRRPVSDASAMSVRAIGANPGDSA